MASMLSISITIDIICNMDWKCVYKCVLMNVSYPHYGVQNKLGYYSWTISLSCKLLSGVCHLQLGKLPPTLTGG